MKKPQFHAFLSQTLKEQTGKTPQFSHSPRSYFYRAGEYMFKVPMKQPSATDPTTDLLIAQKNVDRLTAHSPLLGGELLMIQRHNDLYRLEVPSYEDREIELFVYKMKYFPPEQSFSRMLTKKKSLGERVIRAAEFFAECHQVSLVNSDKHHGTSVQLSECLDDIFYQSKKHLNRTFTPAIAYITEPPLRKFLDANKKTFNKRIRDQKNRIVHGCPLPEKMFMTGDQVVLLPHINHNLQEYDDVLCDIADFTLHLKIRGYQSEADAFITKYFEKTETAHPTQAKAILSFYEVLKCLSRGLQYSFLSASTPQESKQFEQQAIDYYQKSCHFIKQIQ